MIILDFTTDNPRWGKSGIHFTGLFEYAKTLGFLSNIRHYNEYRGNSITKFDNSISIHIEDNNINGAWTKECRIHYYKDMEMLRHYLHDLWAASSAGIKNSITCRINSNHYINHLMDEYDFSEYSSNVVPNEREIIISRFENQLTGKVIERDILSAIDYFNVGWEL